MKARWSMMAGVVVAGCATEPPAPGPPTPAATPPVVQRAPPEVEEMLRPEIDPPRPADREPGPGA